MKRFVFALVLVAAVCAGCDSPAPRLNSPTHGLSEKTSDMQGTFTYMVDNALLADMSVSDVHFIPHRAILNTLGEERLRRLASLIDAYGGSLRYSTDLTEKELVKKRTETIIAFLSDCGVETARQVDAQALPASEGMDAAEVILIRQNEGRYSPKKTKTSGVEMLGGGDQKK